MLKLCFLFSLLYLGTSEGNSQICGSKADVIFLLDNSLSIGQENFPKVLKFVKGIVNNFDVGENNVQVGVVSFSSGVRTEFVLNTFKTKNDVIENIGNVEFLGMETNTGEALKHVTDKGFSTANGHRKGVPKIVVLITDGVSSNPNITTAEATKAKNSGIKIFAVGININGGKDLEELITIASKRDYIFTVDGYALDVYESVVSSLICKTFLDRPNCRKIHNADIVFLLDSSGGIGSSNFTKMKNFVKKIIKEFTVGQNHVQFAVVTFGTKATNIFKLSDYNNTADMEKAMDELQYIAGDSHSHLGLQFLRQYSFTSAWGARDGSVDKIAIVITEGFSNMRNETTTEANKLKALGIKIFAINVGGRVDTSELKGIATNDEGDETQYIFKTLSFAVLQELEPLVLKMVCVRANLQSCMAKADVVFLLDSSCSIGKENFSKMKNFVKLVTHEFYVHKQGIQVGVESFECKNHVLLRLNSKHDKVSVKHTITGLQYMPGGTNTGEALEKLRKDSFSKPYGSRDNVKKIAIIITDGDSKSKSKTFFEAHNARQSGIKLVAIGVGVDDTKEIAGIASRADANVESYMFLPKNFDSLMQYTRNVSSIVCSV